MDKFFKVKEWNEYTRDEKITLLQHWWYYYGIKFRTIEEYEKFDRLVNKDPNTVFKLAIDGYMKGTNVDDLVDAIREKKIGELVDKVGAKNKDDDYRKIFFSVGNNLIDDLVTSYNDPEIEYGLEEENRINEEIENIMKLKRVNK